MLKLFMAAGATCLLNLFLPLFRSTSFFLLTRVLVMLTGATARIELWICCMAAAILSRRDKYDSMKSPKKRRPLQK